MVPLTTVGTNKCAPGNVIPAADAPASVPGHEDQEPHLDAALRHPVRAYAGITATLVVALVHAAGKTKTTHVHVVLRTTNELCFQ